MEQQNISDVWVRRTFKDRLSLNSISPRMLFQGFKPPQFLQLLAGHKQPKSSARPASLAPSSKSKHSRRHRHRHRHRHHSSSKGVAVAAAAVSSRRKSVQQMAMPVPMVLNTKSVISEQEPNMAMPVFIQPLPGTTLQPTHELDNFRFSMPTPTHAIISSEAMDQLQHGGTDLQLCELDVDKLQQASDSARIRGQIVASRAVPPTNADRKHRLSTASGDDDSHPGQVFRVLGRMNSGVDMGANAPQSPVLVTVARNGSITSERSLLPRPADSSSMSAVQSATSDKVATQRSPHNAPSISRHLTRESMGVRSLEQLTASTDTPSASLGAETFTTAQLFASPTSSRQRAAEQMSDFSANADEEPDNDDILRPRSYTKRGSDVSDIAMRKHLFFGDDPIENAAQPGGPEDRQQNNTMAPIAQTVARSRNSGVVPAAANTGRDSSDPAPDMPLSQSYQRHYYPPASRGTMPTAFNELSGADQALAFNMLQARVSGLETRFTCMEAILASIEDELANIAMVPESLGSLRRMVGASRLPANIRPVIRSVDLNPAMAVAPNNLNKTSPSLRSSTAGGYNAQIGGEAAVHDDPAATMQTTTAALADLVERSKEEFDEATTNALSSISAI
ncbi:hypothetical protein EV174_005284, partial [Coemansia sp. RSA 2320]